MGDGSRRHPVHVGGAAEALTAPVRVGRSAIASIASATASGASTATNVDVSASTNVAVRERVGQPVTELPG